MKPLFALLLLTVAALAEPVAPKPPRFVLPSEIPAQRAKMDAEAKAASDRRVDELQRDLAQWRLQQAIERIAAALEGRR